jgi:hypothetical protein
MADGVRPLLPVLTRPCADVHYNVFAVVFQEA